MLKLTGNCLKSPTSDYVSLLQESQSDWASFGEGTKPDQEPHLVPVPTPSQTRLATQLTEEEQIRIAQTIGLIQHLPKRIFDPKRDGSEKKIREWDPIQFLPDDWLMTSFTCLSCMEPVDAALLSSYETTEPASLI
uniref:Uncharacterized protein n=1 Tax=Aotus nancymaae TaxID=37293 RepID=A0A2K5EIK3_AOTNA